MKIRMPKFFSPPDADHLVALLAKALVTKTASDDDPTVTSRQAKIGAAWLRWGDRRCARLSGALD